ncbi:hypothetical protein [Microbacterium thalli]|uniref:hypothetical protein n=1 Tax=Microbacterium thalli TaxID=3027921 RepID=UPI002366E60B|nr:hypothetical protein [Microbacterium thalli]MDD7930068.1 hypothetical protein [Microbacterium thalli]
MTTPHERLAAAKAAPRPHKDVTVCLDTDIAARRDELIQQLEQAEQQDAADQRLSGPNDERAAAVRAQVDAIDAEATSSLVTVRVTRLPGDAWAETISHHPSRPDVPLDLHYGYNLDAVCDAVAKYRHRLDDRSIDPNSAVYAHFVDGEDTTPIEPGEWDDLVSVLAGSEVTLLRDAIWTLNDYEPSARLDLLVKSSGVATRSDSK